MKYIKLFEQFDEWDPFGEESTSELRPGNTLICVDGGGTALTNGEEYTLIRTYKNRGGDSFMVEIKTKKGKIMDGWRLDRFKKK